MAVGAQQALGHDEREITTLLFPYGSPLAGAVLPRYGSGHGPLHGTRVRLVSFMRLLQPDYVELICFHTPIQPEFDSSHHIWRP